MKEKATVESVLQHAKRQNAPSLLTFQNGELAAISKHTLEFCRYTDSETNTESAMVAASDQVYHGVIGDNATNELTDLYICMRDRTTNKVRIVPVEQASLSNHLYTELKTNRMEKLSRETAIVKLYKEFGGRLASRALARHENLKVTADLFKTEVDAIVEKAVIPEVDEQVQNDAHIAQIRPWFNKNAIALCNVYNVEDLIPADLLERLDEEARVVYKTTITKLPIKSEFIRKSIEDIQNAADSVQNLLRLKLLIYMDCLLNVFTAKARGLKGLEISRITAKVENDVRKRFLDGNLKGLMRTDVCGERTLCYFIVMALLINDNYAVDINVLSQELHTTRRKIVKYAQLVNARVTNGTNLLTLCLPSNMRNLPNSYARRKKAVKKF